MNERLRAALEGSGQREQYASEHNLAKRQAIFAFADPARSSGIAPLELVKWAGTERVLDAGCGNGAWLGRVVQQFGLAAAVGLDLSTGMLDSARRAGAAGLVAGDVQALPFCDESFDVALCLWMLYHVPSHEAALVELRRVLRPGGALVVATNSATPRRLDEVFARALASVTGIVRELWLPPLSFAAENGEELVRGAFSRVEVATRINAFAIPSAQPVLAYMESMRGPIEHFVGERIDWPGVEAEARRLVEEIIASEGVFRTDMVSVSFLATKESN